MKIATLLAVGLLLGGCAWFRPCLWCGGVRSTEDEFRAVAVAPLMANRYAQAERAFVNARFRLISKVNDGSVALAKRLAQEYLPGCQLYVSGKTLRTRVLRRIRKLKTWRNPRSGELYILVAVPKGPVARSLRGQLAAALRERRNCSLRKMGLFLRAFEKELMQASW